MKNEQVQAIKNIVNSHLEIDVDFKTRKDLYVKARAICYKILRDECLLTYDFIGQQFQKNHATVLHALNETGGMPGTDAKNEILIYRDLVYRRNIRTGEWTCELVRQKIVYKKVSSDRLIATISGKQQGKQTQESYPMSKK